MPGSATSCSHAINTRSQYTRRGEEPLHAPLNDPTWLTFRALPSLFIHNPGREDAPCTRTPSIETQQRDAAKEWVPSWRSGLLGNASPSMDSYSGAGEHEAVGWKQKKTSRIEMGRGSLRSGWGWVAGLDYRRRRSRRYRVEKEEETEENGWRDGKVEGREELPLQSVL